MKNIAMVTPEQLVASVIDDGYHFRHHAEMGLRALAMWYRQHRPQCEKEIDCLEKMYGCDIRELRDAQRYVRAYKKFCKLWKEE